MLLMGDEVRRTQRGNNNAFCQDNDVTWFDWTLLEKHPGIHRFVKLLNAIRQRRDVLAEESLNKLSLNQLLQRAEIEWHGVRLNLPDWRHDSHSLAFTLRSLRTRFYLHMMLNAYFEPLTFELPDVIEESHEHWRRCIDTALESPQDISLLPEARPIEQSTYLVQPRSVVLLALWLEPESIRTSVAEDEVLRTKPPG